MSEIDYATLSAADRNTLARLRLAYREKASRAHSRGDTSDENTGRRDRDRLAAWCELSAFVDSLLARAA